MNDAIVGAAALALWIVGILVTGLVIRSSIQEYRSRKARDRRGGFGGSSSPPRESPQANTTDTYIQDDAPVFRAVDLDWEVDGDTDDVEREEVFRGAVRPPSDRLGISFPDESKSLDLQIRELATGADAQMARLIRSVRDVPPPATKKRRASGSKSGRRNASRRLTPEVTSAEGISYVTVDDEGRPQTD